MDGSTDGTNRMVDYSTSRVACTRQKILNAGNNSETTLSQVCWKCRTKKQFVTPFVKHVIFSENTSCANSAFDFRALALFGIFVTPRLTASCLRYMQTPEKDFLTSWWRFFLLFKGKASDAAFVDGSCKKNLSMFFFSQQIFFSFLKKNPLIFILHWIAVSSFLSIA